MLKKNKEIDHESLNDVIHLSKRLLRVFYVIIVVGIVLGILIALQKLNLFDMLGGVLKVISPLFIGFIISWLVYPLHKKLTDAGVNKVLSALLIFVGLIGIAILIIYIFIPVLYNQVNELISNIPSILSSITGFISKTFNKIDINGIDMESIKHGLLSASQKEIVNFTSSLPNNIITFVKGLFSALGIIMISLVIGIYMLIDFDDLSKRLYSIFPKKNRKEYITLLENMSEEAHKVVNGTILIATIVFILDTVGFAIFGLDMAVLFGLFCGLTDLIPYIGPYIGGAAAVIVGFTQGPVVGVGVLIVAVVVQVLESYVLQPMVMSKAMKLHPVTIIVGLLLFGYFFGIIGMIIATPCMAIIKEILLFIKHKKEKQKNGEV